MAARRNLPTPQHHCVDVEWSELSTTWLANLRSSGLAVCSETYKSDAACGRGPDGFMARLPRVIAVHGPHHVTQRGNARRFVLDSDTDRSVYLDLLKQSLTLHDVTMMGYCLMSNHVHLVLVPRRADPLGLALKHAHGRYASYWNAIHHSSGHVWQGRYYSCPLDEPHICGSVALYGAQSGASRAGGGGRILDVVQCRRPLCFRFRCGVAGSATVAVPLDYGNLAHLPEGQGRCVRTGRDPSFDAHRTPARDCRIRPCAGTIDATAPGPAEAWQASKSSR